MEEIKRFKNGNMHIHLTKDTIEDIKADKHETPLIRILWMLEDEDCSLIGEQFCLSNYDMGVRLYSWYYGKCYTLAMGADVEDIMEGRTVILKAETPNEYDMEDLRREYDEE